MTLIIRTGSKVPVIGDSIRRWEPSWMAGTCTLGINDAGWVEDDLEFSSILVKEGRCVYLYSRTEGPLEPYENPARNWAPIAFRLAWQQYGRRLRDEALETVVGRLSKSPEVRLWIGPWQHSERLPPVCQSPVASSDFATGGMDVKPCGATLVNGKCPICERG